MNARDLPEAIQWHEGMLLAPQHFQQDAARHELLLQYHLAALAPFHWGVQRLAIDPALLVSGKLRVLDLEAVMPDGLVVLHERHGGEELEVDLAPHAEELKHRPLPVYLAVPARKVGGAAMKGDLARYASIEGAPVVDENTGEGELRVPRLRPRLTLLVTETPPQKYVSFPLARIAYRNETFALTDFEPPVLVVRQRSRLGEVCLGIARRLREKAVFLSEQARAPGTASTAPLLLQTKMITQGLVAALPPFEALLTSDAAHPFPLYAALCGLAGQMAGIGVGLVPPSFAPYNHNDLRATFEQVQDFLFRVIDEGILESHTAIPFRLEDGIFCLTVEPRWLERDLVIGVRGQREATDQDVIAWIEECLIGSRPKIPDMLHRRILGARRQRIDRDGELVPGRGVTFFAVKPEREFIEPSELLQILNRAERAEARRPVEIVLYVRKEGAPAGGRPR
jgi:type VI secretion system protein ImpJ